MSKNRKSNRAIHPEIKSLASLPETPVEPIEEMLARCGPCEPDPCAPTEPHDEAFEVLQGELAEAQAARDSATRRLTASQERVKALGVEVATLQENEMQLKQEIDTLSTDKNESNQRERAAKSVIAGKESEIVALTAKIKSNADGYATVIARKDKLFAGMTKERDYYRDRGVWATIVGRKYKAQ